MIDRELQALAKLPPDRPLDRLEIGVWRAITTRATERRTGRVITSCQAVALVVALLGSVAAGAAAAPAHPTANAIARPSGGLAPFDLLFGRLP